MTPQITTSGRTVAFLADGRLAVLQNGGSTVQGRWRAHAADGEPHLNLFRYDIDGVEQPPLAARYSFVDGTNQLQVVLSAPDGESAPALLVGGIEIDDQHDIVYRLVHDDETETGQVIVLYGDLRISRDTSALTIALAGGGVATVRGARGIKSLQAAQNRIAELAADDLLRFRASTLNVLDGGGSLEIKARLEFNGSWDVQDGQLVFLSHLTGDLSAPAVSIGFGGTLGAVTAGFVYFADDDGTRAAFTIRGQHVWQGGDATTTFNWQSSLGFSDKKFAASVTFDATRVKQDGRRLSLKGGLALKQADGGTVPLSLSLEAEYAWDDHALVFKAIVENSADGFNYDLMLGGQLSANNRALTFAIHYTNATGADALTIGLNVTGDEQSAIQAIAFHLKVSERQIDASIEARFSVRQRFVAGVGRVLEPAEDPVAG